MRRVPSGRNIGTKERKGDGQYHCRTKGDRAFTVLPARPGRMGHGGSGGTVSIRRARGGKQSAVGEAEEKGRRRVKGRVRRRPPKHVRESGLVEGKCERGKC